MERRHSGGCARACVEGLRNHQRYALAAFALLGPPAMQAVAQAHLNDSDKCFARGQTHMAALGSFREIARRVVINLDFNVGSEQLSQSQ